MTDQRTTEVETPSGSTHTHTTIVTDKPRSGGMGKWVLLLALLVVAGLAYVAFSQLGAAEMAKDNAVADAAESVGTAAENVGEAAQDMGDAAQDVVEPASD
ncbi:hypothetical protein [Aurantiacibacter gilvus]|uniref:Uncharacterized protein n=1 Tax=Aurantiacibacter gilvus TaxID=3139141 RepID=A0ABU9IDC1_9SPHN